MVASDPALARLLALLHPSELALRDWVAPQLDGSMVEEVASADYGVDVAEHRRAIEELRRVRRLPNELSWHPEEVLALTRWSTVDGTQHFAAAARRLHLMRLFCCLVLVRAATASGYPVNSVTPLVESAVELGPDAVDAAASYLAWCRLHEPGDWRDDPTSRPILTLALVVLSALLPAGRTPELLPATGGSGSPWPADASSTDPLSAPGTMPYSSGSARLSGATSPPTLRNCGHCSCRAPNGEPAGSPAGHSIDIWRWAPPKSPARSAATSRRGRTPSKLRATGAPARG